MTLAERLPLPSKLGLLAALGSGALLGGAYYFQYVVGLSPCEMCYWQR
jgi:disulfide bond formation protein DsbB